MKKSLFAAIVFASSVSLAFSVTAERFDQENWQTLLQLPLSTYIPEGQFIESIESGGQNGRQDPVFRITAGACDIVANIHITPIKNGIGNGMVTRTGQIQSVSEACRVPVDGQ
jgi:hypothetical protein